MNKVILIGRVGRDPEVKKMPNGNDSVVAVSVATSEKWTDKAGVKQEKTEWHRVTAFGRTADVIGEYCKKGTLVMVEGRIETRKYMKDNEEKSIVEIKCDKLELLSSASEGGARAPAAAPAPAARPAAKTGRDDDIPF